LIECQAVLRLQDAAKLDERPATLPVAISVSLEKRVLIRLHPLDVNEYRSAMATRQDEFF
jgi:hypothetical protein